MTTTYRLFLMAFPLAFTAASHTCIGADGHQIFGQNGANLLQVLPTGRYAGTFETPSYYAGQECFIDVQIIEKTPTHQREPFQLGLQADVPTVRVSVDSRPNQDPNSKWMINDFPMDGADVGCAPFVASIPYTSPYGGAHYTNRFSVTDAPDGSLTVEGNQAKQSYRCVNVRRLP